MVGRDYPPPDLFVTKRKRKRKRVGAFEHFQCSFVFSFFYSLSSFDKPSRAERRRIKIRFLFRKKISKAKEGGEEVVVGRSGTRHRPLFTSPPRREKKKKKKKKIAVVALQISIFFPFDRIVPLPFLLPSFCVVSLDALLLFLVSCQLRGILL